MKNTIKKALSFVLTLSIVLSCFGSFSVGAQAVTIVPEDNSHDIPLSALVASCGDYEQNAAGYNEGPAEFAVDNDPRTLWCTNWHGTSRENHWFQFELTANYKVDGLRYLPRQDGIDIGTITKYEIQVSDDGENFRTVASGMWEMDQEWKVVRFQEENVKYIRLVSLDAHSNNTSAVFTTAAEIRITGTDASVEPHDHAFGEWMVTTAPTCTEAGVETRTCACGETETREIAALGHAENILPAVEPTFDSTGLTEGSECSICGEILFGREVIPALDYNEGTVPLYAVNVSVGDWERNGGANEGPAELAVDGNFRTRWVTNWYGTSNENHWFQFELTEAFTVDGLRYKPAIERDKLLYGTITEYKIQVSDDGVNFVDVATGNWDANADWKIAQFDAQTVKYVRLVSVNAVAPRADIVIASAAEIRLVGVRAVSSEHEHSYNEWTITTAPTCTETGIETCSCRCGELGSEVRVTPALGHTEEILPAVSPTFDSTGLTEGKMCSVCGEILIAQEIVPVLDYDAVVVPLDAVKVSAGDWQTGCETPDLAVDENPYTIWHTSWNGSSIEKHWFQFELTESYTIDGLCYLPRQDGNLTGTIIYYAIQVSDDGENFRTVVSGHWDLDHNWKFSHFQGENIKYVRLVSMHAYSENARNYASAAEIRLTGVKDEGGVHEHTYSNWTVTTAPTCTEAGVEARTCACGETETREIKALGHAEGIISGKDATCTETGLTEGKKCSICGDILVAQEIIPAHGHTEESVSGKEASCTETGLTEGKKCAVCGDILVTQEVIPAHGHAEEIISGKEASCTETGLTEGKKCSICSEILVAQEVIPAHGHAEEIISGKEASCTETGLTEGKKCSICSEILVVQEIIPARGHNYEDGTCSNCGDELKNPFTDVPEGSFYIEPVMWAVEKGITNGVDNTHFAPDDVCNRAVVVTFLWRAAGSPDPTITENPFVDVPEDAFYYKAVLWAVEKGITNGMDATHFGPTVECNRAQFVTFLWRYLNQPETDVSSNFSDVVAGAWYEAAINWAVENAVTNGMGDGAFGVENTCNRAHSVTFLYRALAG